MEEIGASFYLFSQNGPRRDLHRRGNMLLKVWGHTSIWSLDPGSRVRGMSPAVGVKAVEEWRLICLLVILAAMLPAGANGAPEPRQPGEGTGGRAGAGIYCPENGCKDFECKADVAAASVAA